MSGLAVGKERGGTSSLLLGVDSGMEGGAGGEGRGEGAGQQQQKQKQADREGMRTALAAHWWCTGGAGGATAAFQCKTAVRRRHLLGSGAIAVLCKSRREGGVEM
ncbi:hypothetical protein VE02_01077 [Pseudogymnoascus sp. 03VT05]|nr:hypothetical protein VE02_01077 [Pseudogymnoascus sp. 03VT05]